MGAGQPDPQEISKCKRNCHGPHEAAEDLKWDSNALMKDTTNSRCWQHELPAWLAVVQSLLALSERWCLLYH